MLEISQIVIKNPEIAYGYAISHCVRLPNSEQFIKANPTIAEWYANDVLKGPWPTEDVNEIK